MRVASGALDIKAVSHLASLANFMVRAQSKRKGKLRRQNSTGLLSVVLVHGNPHPRRKTLLAQTTVRSSQASAPTKVPRLLHLLPRPDICALQNPQPTVSPECRRSRRVGTGVLVLGFLLSTSNDDLAPVFFFLLSSFFSPISPASERKLRLANVRFDAVSCASPAVDSGSRMDPSLSSRVALPLIPANASRSSVMATCRCSRCRCR